MKQWLGVLWVFASVCAWATDTDNVSRFQVVDELVSAIETHYVLEKNIGAIRSDLNAFSKGSAFTELHDQHSLATALTQLLQQHDKHFSVQYLSQSEPTGITKESWFNRLKRKNSGFKKVEVLDGNIGLIELTGFDDVNDDSKRIVKHAMNFIGQTDAVIIDLRGNGGGSPQMVQLISSYFLPADTHLNSFYHRPSRTYSDFRTPGEAFPHFDSKIPLYLLTSRDTFSAAEEFAYNLKHLKRARVIGEPSKGGANPWQWVSLSSSFRVAIPVSMAINPITQTNWEGKGVIPHVDVKPENAFNRAYSEALQWQKHNQSNPFIIEEITRTLHKIKYSEKMATDEKVSKAQ